MGRRKDGTVTAPVTGQGRGPTHPQGLWANHGDGQLAVNQLKPFFFALFEALLQNRVVFELDGAIALNADNMMMVMGIGLVEFVMFMALC